MTPVGGEPSAAIGVLGLGRTGLPVALNLRARGHQVVGYRRSGSPELRDAGGEVAASPQEVADKARVILSVLPSAAALDDAMGRPDGVLRALRPGHVVVELSSYPLAVKERYRALLAERGAILIDGEISGTPAMTAARTAVVLLAGDRVACDAVLPICRDATDHAIYTGAFGAATKLKLVANLLVAVHTVAAAEAVLLVEKAGIDVDLAIQVLGLGAGSSTMFHARARSMAARSFVDPAPGPVRMLAAYLDPIAELASAADAPVPLFAIASELFKRALAAERAHEDIACVIELLGSDPSAKGNSP